MRNNGIEKAQHGNRNERSDKSVHEEACLEHLILALARFGDAQVTKRRDDGIENLVDDARHGIHHEHVVSVQRDSMNAHKGAQNKTACGGIRNAGNTVQHHGERVLLDLVDRFRVDLRLAFPLQNVGVHAIRDNRNRDILQKRRADHAAQKEEVVVRHEEHRDLRNAHHDLERILVQRHDIFLLVGGDETALVREEIRYARIGHEHEEVQLQIRDVGRVFNKHVDIRGKSQTCRDNDQANNHVHVSEQAHDGTNLLMVLFGQRPIERENDRARHAQVGQRKNGKDV